MRTIRASLLLLALFATASLFAQTADAHRYAVEFTPGKQAQADWAYCGRFRDASGKPVSIYAFVMVLSFSRMLFVRFTTSMKLSAAMRN